MVVPTLEDVRAWDRADPCRPLREKFDLAAGVIYLDGNSLGPPPRETATRQATVLHHEWGERLIRSWGEGWLEAPSRVGDKIARLIGARPGEVVVADSTSVNLFKLVVAGLRLRPGRGVVLVEEGNFPTDRYIAEAACACVPGASLVAVPADALGAALGQDTALLLLTHVHYRSGARHDMAGLTEAAHACGALALWDLSHSTGAVPLDLGGCQADMAVGCGYKFLNGGPGAPAFLYVAEPLQKSLDPPLHGWLGHAAPFDFSETWQPAAGLGRFLCGTPPILSLSALESGVDLFLEADGPALFAKSARLFGLFADLMDSWCGDRPFVLATPRDAGRRGSQIAYAHPEAGRLMQALIARGVIGDYRPPALLRFGLTPMYLGFEDVWRAVRTLADLS